MAALLPQAASAVIAEGSRLAGRTLAETGLAEDLGVLVVGVRRGEEQVTNPGPDFRVQTGDIPYLWGPSEQIKEAQRRAGSQ